MTSGTAAAILSRAAAILASFALTVVVARFVGVESAGVFFLLAAIVTVLATVGRLGTETMVLKLISGEADGRAVRSTVGRLALLTMIGSLGVTIAAALVIALSGFVGLDASSVGVFSAISAVVAQALYVFAGAVLRGLGKIAIGVFAELGSAPSMAVVVILIFGAMDAVLVDLALVIFATTSWLTAGWSMAMVSFWLRRLAGHSGAGADATFRFDRAMRRSLASMMGVSVIYFASIWSPVFLLSALDSIEAVALYTAAVRLANIVSLIPSIQTSYLAPRFAGLIRAGATDGLNTLAGRSALIATLLAALPTLVLALGSSRVVEVLYGEDFGSAAPLLVVLALGALAIVALGQVSQLALLAGLEHEALIVSTLSATAWATAGALAILSAGVEGAAVSATAIGVGYALALSIRLYRVGVRSWMSWRRATSSEE